MIYRKYLLLFFLFIPAIYFPQSGSQLITVIGDSLTGRNIGSESIREVIGSVILTQGNIRITCDRALQYLSRNNAVLEGNVVVTQDTLTIRAQKGFYNGNTRIAECNTGVQLDDKKVILTAVNGNYYFNEQRAYFSGHVKFYDTVSTTTCDLLDYFKNENKAVAVGNVKIVDSLNTIMADSLTHFRNKRITFAQNNVSLANSANNVIIYGGHLENYADRKYSLVNDNPLLIQIDTLNAGGKDTLIISSGTMESYNDSSAKFIATDSVKIIRGDFASKNSYSVYYRNEERIITGKKENDINPPVLWYENSQLSGDSINIFLMKNHLDRINVFNNSFVVSKNKTCGLRYDQISGDSLTMYFDTSGINHTDVTGNVLSIYYMYDNDIPNGLTKSSAQRAKIIFKKKLVGEVKLYVSPVSEYYPEMLVDKNELTFTLPAFVIYKNRPVKEKLLNKTGSAVVKYQPE
ncbi:MAG: OstA-like protein [Ignavibacteria bacterium]